MMALLLYLAAGLLLFVCLVLLFLRENVETPNDDVESRQPHAFWSADGSAMLIARQLFGNEDWQYVEGLDSKALEKRFLKERTTLALHWLGAARSEARTLIRAHRAAASTSSHLNLAAELRISYVYIEFLLYCALLELVIRTRGPVALQSLVASADDRSVRLYEAVGQVFPFSQPAEDDLGHSAASHGRRG